jgi:hypothetical protein
MKIVRLKFFGWELTEGTTAVGSATQAMTVGGALTVTCDDGLEDDVRRSTTVTRVSSAASFGSCSVG